MTIYPLIELAWLLQEVFRRNTDSSIQQVYSVTNAGGFKPSEEFFSKQVYSRTINNYKVVYPGEFAYNPSRVNVGSIDYLKINTPVAISPMYVVFSADTELIGQEYLLLFLKSSLGLAWINHLTAGSVREVLRFDDLGRIQIPLPPLSEQRRIVEILRQVDKLRQLRLSALNQLEKLQSAIFLHQFGTGMPTDRYPNTAKLKSLLKVPLTSGFSPVTMDSSTGIPIFSLGALTDNLLDDKEVKYIELNEYAGKGDDLEIDDILISRSNTLDLVGRVGRYQGKPFPVIYPDLMIRIRLQDSSDSPYLENYLRSSYMKSVIRRLARGTSSSMKKISQRDINEFDILWPPEIDRREFGKSVNHIRDLWKQQADSLETLNKLFDSLISRFFTGKLTEEWRNIHAKELVPEATKRDHLLSRRREIIHITASDISIATDTATLTVIYENKATSPVLSQRPHLFNALSKMQQDILNIIASTNDYFTTESLDLNESQRRTLQLLSATGLIQSIAMPSRPSEQIVYVSVYRSLTENDDVRASETILLEQLFKQEESAA